MVRKLAAHWIGVLVVLGILLVPAVAGQPGSGESTGHAAPPFVFAPLIEDGWRETAAEIAAGLPWADPIVPGMRNHRVERAEDGVLVRYTTGPGEWQSLVLPVTEEVRSYRGVAPAELPVALVLKPAWYRMGWSSSTKVAATTAMGPPGTFDALGTGAEGVRAVAMAMGVPIGHDLERYVVEVDEYEERNWRRMVESRSPHEELVLFGGGGLEAALRCTCTRVVLTEEGMGTTANRLVGFHDPDGRVFLVHTTPWVDMGRLDFGDPTAMEEAARRHVNETNGTPLERITVTFREYGLQGTRDDMLRFAGFVSVKERLGLFETAHHSIAVDPASGEVFGPAGMSEVAVMPAAGTLAVLVALLALIGPIRRARRRRLEAA